MVWCKISKDIDLSLWLHSFLLSMEMVFHTSFKLLPPFTLFQFHSDL